MTFFDFSNALISACGGALQWVNVRKLHRDKRLRGVHWTPNAFYFGWSCWNLAFYTHLHQWVSLLGGTIILCANGAWLALAVAYRKN